MFRDSFVDWQHYIYKMFVCSVKFPTYFFLACVLSYLTTSCRIGPFRFQADVACTGVWNGGRAWLVDTEWCWSLDQGRVAGCAAYNA